jgi:Domain of unknown function (DUF4384)
MLMSLLLLASSGLTPSTPAVQGADDPPVRVWFNSDGNYAYGDRAKVYVRSAEDRYVVVLRSDAAGRVRVLFPLDPGDDQRITAGKKHELKSRGGREAFVADDIDGHGTVLAAISSSPFRVENFARDDRWDFRALSDSPVRDDPESRLLSLVQRMKPVGEQFVYDVATYVVSEQYARRPYPYPYSSWGYDPWWSYGYGPRFGVGFWYRPWYYYGYGYRGRWWGW